MSIPSVTVPDAVAEASAASGQAQHGKKQAQPAVQAHNKASPVESPSPSTTGGRAPGDDKAEPSLTSSSSGGGNRAAGDDKGERTGTSSSGGNRAAGDDKGQR